MLYIIWIIFGKRRYNRSLNGIFRVSLAASCKLDLFTYIYMYTLSITMPRYTSIKLRNVQNCITSFPIFLFING